MVASADAVDAAAASYQEEQWRVETADPKASTDRMSRLFDSGEHERQRRQKMQAMDKDLQDFKRKKPGNPFGEG